MRLSLWILKNWLKEFEPELQTAPKDEDFHSIDEICIEKARLYDHADFMEEGTIYVGASEKFFPHLQRQVVCCFREDYLILHTEDIILVFNQILNAFYFYESWEKRMNLLMARQCSLTELLDASDEILESPLLIFDSSDEIIAVSTAYLNVEVDEHWFRLLDFGATDPNQSVDFHRKDSSLFDHNNHMPFYIPAGFFPNSTWSQNIFRENEWCGICVIIEYSHVLDMGMLHLFYLFSQMIQSYSNTQSEHSAFRLQSAFFLEAIDGQAEQRDRLQRKLLANQWESQDKMILLKAVPLSAGNHAHMYLCRIFTRYSPYIFPAVKDNEILLLCNISRISKKELFDFLKPWLKNSFHRCGVSQPFRELEELSAACKQADIALNYGGLTAGGIHEIHDHMVHWLIRVLKDHTDDSVVHPALKTITDYDQKYHTDYGRTLYCYLQNERNSLLTARQLNIHRNTLFHRLERIREQFQLDLDQPQERFYLLLSFYYQNVFES